MSNRNTIEICDLTTKQARTDVILFVVSHCLMISVFFYLFSRAQWQWTNGDTTNDRTKDRTRDGQREKEAEMSDIKWISKKKQKKKINKHLHLCRWFVVCRFIMSSESPCPMYRTYCACSSHTAHHYCHDIQHGHTFYFLFFLAALVWSALRHYRMQCYCLHCQRLKRQETYLHIKNIL